MAARETNKQGCLGCAAVFALFVGVLMAFVLLIAPSTIGLTIRAYAERAFKSIGETLGVHREQDEAPDATLEEPSVSLGAPVSLGNARIEEYLRGKLDEGCQEVYDQLIAGVRSQEESIAVIDATPEDVSAAYKAMMGDHPEFFWLDGSFTYMYSSLLKSVTVQLGYEVEPSEVEATRAAIEAEADAILAGLPENATEYDVALLAYEHIASHTDYVVGAPHNQTIQSVLLGHASVCAGYARTYQYLLQRAGVFCTYVEGSIPSRGEDHAWNLVRIDGQYAFVDPTWADPTYLGEGDSGVSFDGVIYDYLGLTTADLLRDDHAFAEASIWPDCAAPELDFFRRAGLFIDVYDEQAIDEVFWRQVNEGKSRAAFKFGTDEAYGEALAALAGGTFERDSLLELAAESGETSIRYSYATSDALRIVKLYW
ncbi:MAG: hypothetical protein IKF14_10270 [Atopobiaceae bacterium]|nr:hypothetical protein [Atopobiaceae bacterium]